MGRHPTHVNTKELFNLEGPPAPPADQHRAAKFHCPFCTLSWNKLGDYNRHISTHNNAKPYACKHKGCQKSFSQKTALVTHWNTHTGARPHHCRHPGCSSAFGDPSSRTRHEKETHNPANGYKCRKCSNVSKRREQFRRHYKECLKKEPLEDQLTDAREYCAEAYAEQVAKGVITTEVLAPPPKRKRRGAIAVVSPSSPPEEYDDEDELSGRGTPPKYEPSYTGELSSESTITSSPNFYRANDEPTGGSPYGDAFEPAYTPLPGAKYYSQPPPQYTPHDSSSPESQFDHPMSLPRMNSPPYSVHGMGDRMLGSSYSHGRLPTTESPSFSVLHSPPGHTGNYSVSTPHISSSPHLSHSPHDTVSSPPLLMPVATRQAVLFDHTHDSPPFMYPQSGGYGSIDSVGRIPRSGVNSGHPQLQSRSYLHQYRHHPYARDHRGGPSGSAHGHTYTGSPSLPMVDNSYGGHTDPDSDPIPPLSLAGARAIKPMMESYESTTPF